jgi:hypothetical protein
MSAVDPVIFNNETWCAVDVATNLYHTSSSAVPLHGLVCDEAVAFCTVPCVTVPQLRSEFTVKLVALVHSLFAGGGGTQLKLAVHPTVPAWLLSVVHTNVRQVPLEVMVPGLVV